jgi:hypothetical protein
VAVLCLLLSLFASAAAEPVAEAGLSLMAYEGYLVVLNGSASEDPEGDPLSFSWTQTSGPEVDLQKADTDSPEFTVPAPGTYRFELVVSDGVDLSEPDTVEVIAPFTLVETGDTGCTLGSISASWLLLALGLGLLRRSQ